MTEKKKELSGDDYMEAMNYFPTPGETEILVDPETVVASSAEDETQRAIYYGEKLRTEREKKGFSIEEIARETGIEEEMLSQVEQGNAFLPLGQMVKITKMLSMRVADVITGRNQPFSVVRANKRQQYTRFGKAKQASHGYKFEALAPEKRDRDMEPFLVTLYPASPSETSTHGGQEFIYVLEGEVEITIGNSVEIVHPGDSVYYDSSNPHLLKALGDRPAKILAVLSA